MVSTWAAVGNMPVVERLMFQQQYIKLWIIPVPKWKVISSVCLISSARTLPSSSSAHYCSCSNDEGWQRWDSNARSGGRWGGRRGERCVLYFHFIQGNTVRSISEAGLQDFELSRSCEDIPGKKKKKKAGIIWARHGPWGCGHPPPMIYVRICFADFLSWGPTCNVRYRSQAGPVHQHSSSRDIY